jgi:SAM-dependent methyltransferase
VRVLHKHLVELMPQGASVLDVGCGDGRLARLIQEARPDLSVSGIDVVARPQAHIPVQVFDGETIPAEEAGIDVILFVDVLHHTADPMVLLAEAARVARRAIVIKDHNRDGLFAGPTLRFMDYVGNAHHGVALPYNYWARERWHAAFETLGLVRRAWKERLELYPAFADWIFGRSLHFVASLEPTQRGGSTKAPRHGAP